MTTITYVPYDDSYAEDVKRMINDAFHVGRYLENKNLLDSALEVYLRERLVNSTYACVAAQDGRAVGVIMGTLAGHRHLPGRVRNRLKLWCHTASVGARAFTDRAAIATFLEYGKVYAQLRRAANTTLGDELGLFIVDASTRGTGVGKALFDRFIAHLRRSRREPFYLYTDSLCTYQFYERRGMERAAAADMQIRLDGAPKSIGIYLYTGATTPPSH